ncbi:MAG: DNA repair protein RecN, partial [Bacteroidota bacterium]
SIAEQDYLRYQLEELTDASLKAGEQAPLESELEALSNSGLIREKIETVIASLEGDQDNIIQRLAQLSAALQGITKFSPGILTLHDRMKSVSIELKDILTEAENLADSFMPDTSRTEEIEARLDVLYRLQKKHRVSNEDELIVLMDALLKKLGTISSISETLEAKRKESDNMKTGLMKMAGQLTAARNKFAPKLEKTIRSMMQEVSLPNASFSIELVTTDTEVPGPNGSDKARFLFSANKGVLPAEIGKSASGGELSRLMLCIKAAVADSMELPVMIFDEIDTGISGETALRMGTVLKRLSGHHQLLAITHLPQIAGKGDVHFFVRKRTESKRTVT